MAYVCAVCSPRRVSPVIRALSELRGRRLVTVATLQAQVERVNAQWPMLVPLLERLASGCNALRLEVSLLRPPTWWRSNGLRLSTW